MGDRLYRLAAPFLALRRHLGEELQIRGALAFPDVNRVRL
jgi:hypothetical protein